MSDIISGVEIIPAILATNEQQYFNSLEIIEDSLIFNNSWVQIDLMDNQFVPNRSINTITIRKYPTKLKLEAHLMVSYPDNWIDDLISCQIKRIIFPAEDGTGIEERINRIRNHNIEVGLSINPETHLSKVEKFIDRIDVLLIMSVHPGFGGQEFIHSSLSKIEKAKIYQNQSKFKIEVDGGIKDENIQNIILAGANYLVIGSHLINGNIKENFQKIQLLLRSS